jgi:SNF2 family DNA or RNA helicase
VSELYVPHDYQEKAILAGIRNGAMGYLVAPGLGKTSVLYSVFNILQKQRMVNRMLVIAPLRVAFSVWPREAKKWSNFEHLKVVILHGPKKVQLLDSDADVFVINPEGLEWLFEEMGGKTFQKFDMLVVDESTQFKNSNTKRFKLMRKYVKQFRRRYILTGSPAPNGLIDLFGQIYILDGGASLGSFISHYRNKFFDKDFMGFNWTLRPGAEAKIYEAIAPLTLRLAAEDYLNLPPLIFNDIMVEMSADSKRIYDQMEQMMLTEVAGDTITAANAAAATTKCRQIANGGIYKTEVAEDDKRWEDIHLSKIEAVKSLVEELSGKPALVAYEFEHDLARLQTAFPEAPFLGGGISHARQAAIEDAWNAGSLPVLLAQPQSVAHGLNLQGTGAAVVWHSLTWNLEHYEQLIRRVWRQGQAERVVVHHILCRDTVDEVILKTLRRKDKTQQNLLDALKEYARARLAA